MQRDPCGLAMLLVTISCIKTFAELLLAFTGLYLSGTNYKNTAPGLKWDFESLRCITVAARPALNRLCVDNNGKTPNCGSFFPFRLSTSESLIYVTEN